AELNASIIEGVLSGREGAARDAVLLNAAAVFVASGRAADWRDGAAMAADSVDSGRAAAVLESIRRFSRKSEQAVPQSA
ncbi:MAG: anthranilate phosphoribosyltransferase, partial [Aminobacteriaceae bacterium]